MSSSSEEGPSKEVPTEDDPMTQNPLYDDTDDEEDVLPKLKEPIWSESDGMWRWPSSSSDDDDEDSEEEEEEAGVVSWRHITPGVTEGVDGEAEDCSCGAAQDRSEEPVLEDVTMDENPGAAAAQDGGSNEFRTDR